MASNNTSSVDILDMRAPAGPQAGGSIRDDIVAGLSKPSGEKTIPTLLLYDELGLKIYDEITTDAIEYYLFPAEELILKNKADQIVEVMHSAKPQEGSVTSVEEVVVELGAG